MSWYTKMLVKLNDWLRLLLSHSYYLIGTMHRYWGNAYGLVEEHERAVDNFTRALGYDPNFAAVYLERGILYWRELNHPRRAIHDLTIAYTLDPHLSEARFNRAIAHQQLREYDQALADFQAYLAEGTHPYWRAHAETMIHELQEWMPAM